MTVALYALFAVFVGAIFSLQPVINAAAIQTLGTPVAAATLSVTITLACLLVLMVATGGGTLKPAALTTLPWWVFLGGVIGAFVVAGGAAIAPITGAALLFVCLVTGQLFGSAIADHFGAFGLEQRPISALKLVGLCLVLAGALLVQRS